MELQLFTDHFVHLWGACPDTFSVLGCSYSRPEQQLREQRFREFQDSLKMIQKKLKAGIRNFDSASFFTNFGIFLKQVYGFSDESLAMILSPEFKEVSRSFFTRARKFDPELKPEEIYQALRNMWIMNGLQLICSRPVALTPSLFAYSLLYPYSDNLLDDPSVSVAEKQLFSQRFEKRLRGVESLSESYRERKISELVGMIEEEYPRADFPGVYESLLAIHGAQTRSLQLAHPAETLTDDDILRISFEKGGASVLADGFLVAGELTPAQQQFFFGFGVWLQLADDIQDAPKDRADGVQTLFSSEKNRQETVDKTNRTFHFGQQVLEGMTAFSDESARRFRSLISQSIELMLIQSVGLNPSAYPDEYRMQMESFSPVSFPFLRKAKASGRPQRMNLVRQLIDLPV